MIKQVTVLAVCGLMAACGGTEEQKDQNDAVNQQTAPVEQGVEEEKNFCHEMTLTRAACADEKSDCPEKSVVETTCAEGGSAAVICLYEEATGDLYWCPSMMPLENSAGRWRNCTEEENERASQAQRARAAQARSEAQ